MYHYFEDYAANPIFYIRMDYETNNIFLEHSSVSSQFLFIQGFSSFFLHVFPTIILKLPILPPTLQLVYVCLLLVRSWDRGYGPAGDDGHPVRSGDEEGHVPHRLPALQGAALQAHGHPQVGSPWFNRAGVHILRNWVEAKEKCKTFICPNRTQM